MGSWKPLMNSPKKKKKEGEKRIPGQNDPREGFNLHFTEDKMMTKFISKFIFFNLKKNRYVDSRCVL